MLREFLAGTSPYYEVPSFPLPSREYYVSASGGGDGLSSSTPMSVSNLITEDFNDGDTIRFNKGDTFYLSELDIDNVYNLTITSYGTGADPILTGSVYIGSAVWTNEGSNQWSTPLASAPKWVYISGTAAKQSESAWIPVTVNVSAQVRRISAATLNALSATVVGATMAGKEYDFRMSAETTVTGADLGTGDITFTGTIVGMDANMPLKFFNQRQFLTTNGDWCYVDGKLYVRATSSPSGTDIRVSDSDYGIRLSHSFGASLSDIEFKHYYKYGIEGYRVPDVTIDGCVFNHNRGNGLRISGFENTNLLIQNCTVSHCGIRGIEVSGVNVGSINNNSVYNIGVDANMGRPFDFSNICGAGITRIVPRTGFSASVCNNLVIEKNIIHDTAYEGIGMWGPNNTIRYNYVYSYMAKFSDGGGIYTSYGNYLGLFSSSKGTSVHNNIVSSGIGSREGIAGGGTINCIGIYFDNGMSFSSISDNTVYNPGNIGILVNFYTTNNSVTGNKVLGATSYNIRIREDINGLVPYFDYFTNTGCVLTGNISAVSSTTARNANFYNLVSNTFTTADNNHYVQPYTDQVNSKLVNVTTTNYTLAEWKTFTGKEASSTSYSNYKVTPAVGDVMVQLNPTDAAVDFNIPALHTDVYGNAPSNPVVIAPWSGILYLKSP